MPETELVLDPGTQSADKDIQLENKGRLPDRLTQLVRVIFLGVRNATQRAETQVPVLDQRLSRRAFLKKAAAVGAGAALALTVPGIARGQSASQPESTSTEVPIDNPMDWPIEQYHSQENEVRALYEKTIAAYGYQRFLYAVSEQYPLDESFPTDSAEVPLVDAGTLGITARENVEVAEIAAPFLSQMLTDAKAAGFTPYVASGFRSIQYQEQLFNRNVHNEMQARGISQEEAEKIVKTYSAPPRTSEHHLGLAVDVLAHQGQSWDEARLTFNQGFFLWLREHAHQYGFVLSFPTGLSEYESKRTAAVKSAEPWHLRFVGKEVAEYFVKSNYLHPETSASVKTLLIDPYFES